MADIKNYNPEEVISEAIEFIRKNRQYKDYICNSCLIDIDDDVLTAEPPFNFIAKRIKNK